MFGGVYARAGGARHRLGGAVLFVFLAVVVVFAGTGPAGAANPKYAAIVVDGHTGKTLYARHADSPRYPASLTKMMTLYLLFTELKAGRIGLGTPLKVSKRAAGQPPSRLGLKPGSSIRVRDAILALVTKSANDVAAVVAENLAGSERRFARRMTRTARRLGMKRTRFRNASGLPDSKQVTTAREIAILARALRSDFPRYFRYFKTRAFKYRGRTYRNHNRLLGRVKGADGIKTGYTRASGYNLATSVRRNGRYVIGVVFGGRSGRSRNRHMKALLQRTVSRAVARKDMPGPTRLARGRTSVPANATAPVPVPRPAVLTPETGDSTASLPEAQPLPKAKRPPQALADYQPDRPTVIVPPTGAGLARTVVPAEEKPAQDDNSAGSEKVAAAPVGPAPTPVAAGDTDAEEEPAVPEGWTIQIGAFSTEEAARQRLSHARETGVRAITGKPLMALAATDTARPIYRARIAGFENGRQARRACRALKRRGIRCYTIAPN